MKKPTRAFPYLDFVYPDLRAVPFGKAPPVRYPEETCRCCLLPATRRVFVRWDPRRTIYDSVACCDDHARLAGTRFKTWLSAIRFRDFLRERDREIEAEYAEID